MSKKIVETKKDSKGNTTSVKFSGNKNFTPIKKAIKMANNDQIENAHTVRMSNGKKYLKSNPDNKTSNNLDELASK